MRRVVSLYESTVGKKVVMALSGTLLLLFVLAHMVGNLKIYQGAEKFDAYAHFLREVGYPALGHGQMLWIARGVLLVCVGVHILAAVQLSLLNWRARSARYVKKNDLSFTYASRTMRWGGGILLAFVVYHLLHLTSGTVHPEFSHDSAYRNVVSGFQSWPVAVAYVLAMIPLGLHIYHGLWSATQSLALRNPRIVRWRRTVAGGVALIIVLGNISIPVAVLAGIVS